MDQPGAFEQTRFAIRNAELQGYGVVDVLLAGDTIERIGPGIAAKTWADGIDARGGALIPGLHDHHVHLLASGAAAASIRLGPPTVRDPAAFRRALAKAAAETVTPAGIRAIHYHESVAGPLSASLLDGIVSDVPVRIQHRSGGLWILNTRALERTGALSSQEPGVERDELGNATGRLWRMDAWLRERHGSGAPDLLAVARDAARLGITGFTDADPERPRSGAALFSIIPQRLHLMGPVGFRVGDDARQSLGPVKVLLDDDRLPALDDLGELITAAHAEQRPVAIHAVTSAQLVLAVIALETAGSTAGDRIEHGAYIPAAMLARVRRLGVVVVTQPGMVAERGDQYLADHSPSEQENLWRCQSLVDAGIGVAGSTDAPFGTLDPWLSMRAASTRETPSRQILGSGERLTPRAALCLFLGDAMSPQRPRVLAPGATADLCLLNASLADALREPSRDLVAATIICGMIIE